jgi:Ca2+-binding RTX toxin-like protein
MAGSANNDSLDGDAGNDTLVGNAGNDSLIGGDGTDQLIGGAGDDLYRIGAGDGVTELANGGRDAVQLLHTAAVNYVAPNNVEDVGVFDGEGVVAGINITGNTLDNLLSGNDAANRLVGGAGNDELYGFGGDDTLLGDAGNDTLGGGTGGDSMAGAAGSDLYYVDDAGDIVNETMAGSSGIDTVDVTMGEGLPLTTYALPTGVENASIDILNGSGGSFTGNNLANHITFDAVDSVTVNAAGGNDTVVGSEPVDALDGITLDGGDGTDTLELALNGGTYNGLSAAGFETITLQFSEGVTWNVADEARYELSGGGSLTLGAQLFTSSYRLEDFGGNLTLNFAENGVEDTLAVDLAGGNSLSLITTGAETLDLTVEGVSNTLTTSTMTGTEEIELGGQGSLGLMAAGGQQILLESYSGTQLSFFAAAGSQSSSFHVDDSHTTIELFAFEGVGFNTISLDTTGAGPGGSDIRLEAGFGGAVQTIALTGEADEILRLETTFLAGESVTLAGGAFDGDLFWTNSGANAVTYNAGDSDDTLYLNGAVNEVLNYGANLNQDDFVFDASGGDFDSLSADLTDFQGGLFIENIRNVTFSFNAPTLGGNEFIDADFITSDGILDLTLNGVEGVHAVTLENLHGNLNVAGLDLSVSAFALSLTGEGLSLSAGAGTDTLAMDGASDDTLNGGAGSDKLTGGAGSDTFVFDSTPDLSNVDTVTDFEAGADKIVLDEDVFAGVQFAGEGLDPGQFTLGDGEGDVGAAHRIVYDAASGQLYYDADGGTSAGRIQFAQLGGGDYGVPIIDASDILVQA